MSGTDASMREWDVTDNVPQMGAWLSTGRYSYCYSCHCVVETKRSVVCYKPQIWENSEETCIHCGGIDIEHISDRLAREFGV